MFSKVNVLWCTKHEEKREEIGQFRVQISRQTMNRLLLNGSASDIDHNCGLGLMTDDTLWHENNEWFAKQFRLNRIDHQSDWTIVLSTSILKEFTLKLKKKFFGSIQIAQKTDHLNKSVFLLLWTMKYHV